MYLRCLRVLENKMSNKVRLYKIEKLKKKILKELDEFGKTEVKLGELLIKLRKFSIEFEILKKYVGLCYEEGYIDIGAPINISKAKIKSSLNLKTPIQITSEGQKFYLNKTRYEHTFKLNLKVIEYTVKKTK